MQVCSQVPVNLVLDLLLAVGIVLVNLRYVLEPKANKIEEEQKVTPEQHAVWNKSELLSHQQCPEISGKLFQTGCPCLSEITTNDTVTSG